MKLPLLALVLLFAAINAHAVEPCRADQLKPTFDGGTGGGHNLVTVFLKNISGMPCKVKGYPNLIFFNGDGRITREVEFRRGWPMGTELPPVFNGGKLPLPPPAETVLLNVGAEAEFEMYFANGTGVEDEEKNCTDVEYSLLWLAPNKPRLKLGEPFRFCYGVNITSIRKAWNSAESRHLTPSPECLAEQLEMTSDMGAAAGTIYLSVFLRNKGKHDCFLDGYPRIAVVGSRGRKLNVQFQRMNPPDDPNPEPASPGLVPLQPGVRAEFLVAFLDGGSALPPEDRARDCLRNARMLLKIGRGTIELGSGEYCNSIRSTSYKWAGTQPIEDK